MAKQWFVKVHDEVQGPFTSSQLKDMAERRAISPDSLVSLGSGQKWSPARRVKGLFALQDHSEGARRKGEPRQEPNVPVASAPKAAAAPAPLSQQAAKYENKVDIRKVVWSVVDPLQTTLQDPNKIIALGPACVPVVIDVFLHPKEPTMGIACNQATLACVLDFFAGKGNPEAAAFLRRIASDEVGLYDTWGQSAYEIAKAYITEQDPSVSDLQKFRTANPHYEIRFERATSLAHEFINSSTGSHGLFLVGGASSDSLLEEIRGAFSQNFWSSEEHSDRMSILEDIPEGDLPTWWISEGASVEELTVRRTDDTVGWHLWADKPAGKCHMWRWYREKS